MFLKILVTSPSPQRYSRVHFHRRSESVKLSQHSTRRWGVHLKQITDIGRYTRGSGCSSWEASLFNLSAAKALYSNEMVYLCSWLRKYIYKVQDWMRNINCCCIKTSWKPCWRSIIKISAFHSRCLCSFVIWTEFMIDYHHSHTN